jgi:hypothetical protein
MRRHLTKLAARKETRFIWTMVAIIVIILAIALWGYFTGGWNVSAN